VKKLFYLIILPFFFLSCWGPKGASKHSADAISIGSSFETAVVIKETSEVAGIKAEYEWLDINYPGYTSQSQALVVHKKHPYDILCFQTSN